MGVYGSLASQIIESSVESSVSPLQSEDGLQNIVDQSVADPASIENLGGPADTGTLTQDLKDDLFGGVAEAQIELIEEYVNEFSQGRVDARLIID